MPEGEGKMYDKADFEKLSKFDPKKVKRVLRDLGRLIKHLD